MSSKKSVISGPVKAPLGSYPKLWRLLDHYFLKEEIPDRAAVHALDTLVELNDAVLKNPKSANLRSIRSSEARIRNLVEMGGTEILTEIGWSFKVMSMEECWVLPYDADLPSLKIQQDKLVETQLKLRARYAKSIADASGKAEKDKAERLAVIKQIEHDKAEREHRNALRTGAPPKVTLSLDEVRKQAVKERMERDKAKKAQAAASSKTPTSPAHQLPGTFPHDNSNTTTSRGLLHETASTTTDSQIAADDEQMELNDDENDDDESADFEDNDMDEERLLQHAQNQAASGASGQRLGRATGGRSPRQLPNLRQRKKAPVPISVKKPVLKQGYQATENTLGGTRMPEEEGDSSIATQRDNAYTTTSDQPTTSRSRNPSHSLSQDANDLLD